MTENKMYIQVKRRNQSFCFLFDSSDNGRCVKECMLDAMRQQSGNNDAAAANSADSSTPAAALTVDDLLLLHADTVTVFDDTQVLSDCDGVKSTQTSAGVSVLYIVTKRRHTGTTSDNDDIDDEWEPVDVVSMEHEQYHQQLVDESATVAT